MILYVYKIINAIFRILTSFIRINFERKHVNKNYLTLDFRKQTSTQMQCPN
jgi:hypothetical protein